MRHTASIVSMMTAAVSAGFAADHNVPPAGKAGRSETLATSGMVATSHPLAAPIGLDVLKRCGNENRAAVSSSSAGVNSR